MAEEFKNELRKSIDYYKQVSDMSIEKKLSELGNLKKRRSKLEKSLSKIGTNILIIDSFPDVAEEKVKRDDLALALLKELNKKGDIAYRNFIKGYGESNKSNELKLNLINSLTHYIELLKTAQLIERKEDTSCLGDYIISLTEKGKNFDYGGKHDR